MIKTSETLLRNIAGGVIAEPHGPHAAIFEHERLICSRGGDHVKQHPQHREEEQNDEEDLPVNSGDGHSVEGTTTVQSTAQDQDVDGDDGRQEPPFTVLKIASDCGGARSL